jgi:hypothetical protein
MKATLMLTALVVGVIASVLTIGFAGMVFGSHISHQDTAHQCRWKGQVVIHDEVFQCSLKERL